MLFNNQRGSMGCRLLDISMSGVRIELDSDDWLSPGSKNTGVPASFKLEVPALGIEADCRVAWRRKSVVGARFVGRVRPIARQFHKRRSFGAD